MNSVEKTQIKALLKLTWIIRFSLTRAHENIKDSFNILGASCRSDVLGITETTYALNDYS